MKRHSQKYYGFDVNTKTIVLDNITSEFLKNMRSIRKNLGFTQEFIANYANVQRTAITGYERRYSNPLLVVLIKLAEVLKTDISESINYKFFYRKIDTEKIRRAMRVYGLSFTEISTMTGWDARTISIAARAKPNASIHCLNDLLQVINKEKTAFAVRQHLTRKKAGDDYA